MLELLNKYSITEIIVFLVTFALAVKGVISYFDWIQERLKKVLKKENKIDEVQDRLAEGDKTFKILQNGQKELETYIKTLENKINLLISSDKDDIKSYITEKHHYFVYKKKWIDDYSLDCVERRFKHYEQEGGNSFIKELMEEIRELPKHAPRSEDQD